MQESEKRFRNLIEGSIQGILVVRDFKPLFVNQAYADMYGYETPADILQMGTVMPLIAPQDRDRRKQYQDIRLHGEGGDAPTHYEHRAVRKDGTIFWVETQIRIITWEGSTAIQSTNFDITTRKQAEEELRESEERFRELVEGSIQGIIIHQDFKPVFVNQSYADIHGYESPEEILAQESIFLDAPPAEHAMMREYTARRLRGDSDVPRQFEMQHLRQDGTTIWLDMRVKGVNWAGGPAIQATVFDITERKQSETHLAKVQTQLVDAIESLTEGFVYYDAEDRLVLCNNKFQQFYDFIADRLIPGVRFEDLSRTSCYRGQIAEAIGREEDWVRERLEQHQHPQEQPLLQPLSNGRWLQVSERRTTDGGIVGVCTDVTEFIRREEALQESEARLSEAQRTTHVGSWETNLSTGTIVWSDEFYRILGYTPGEVEADYDLFHRHIHPEDHHLVGNTRAILVSGQSFQYEARLIHLDGSVHWVAAYGDQAVDQNGIPVRFYGTLQDITERKESERRLQISRDRYRLVTDNLPVVITYVDTELILRFYNKTFTDWFDMDPADQYAGDILGEKAFQVVKPYMERALLGEYVTYDSIVPYQHGGARHVSANYIPHIEDSGKVRGFFALIEDITERKQLEEQLRQAQKMEAIGTLAGGIAHDFNNILAVIFGYTELATLNLDGNHPSLNNLQEVLKASNRAKDLVQQILTFSRQSKPESKPVQLQLIVNEVLGLLRSSIPTTIEIRSSLLGDSCTILADETQIHQVVLNLCANAEHAMRDTSGTLEICLDTVEVDAGFVMLHPELNEGSHVHLTIRDTGHGIDPEMLERIFDPFFTTKEIGEGTGLGLSVVHGIIANHNGVITVRSTPGEGTTFEIYLPRIDQIQTADRSDQPEQPMPHGTGRILFVDDEEALVHLGQAMLERLGYEVVARTNSFEALEAFRAMSQQFDLVITDQTMPNMTGEMLVPEIRRIRPDIPVILCTGFSHTMNAAKAQSMGIDAFLMKPLVIRDVAVTIQQVLAGQEALPKTQPGGRILLIDDDDQLRFMLRQVLETAGYEVIDASNGRQGIQRFKETPADLVITDLIMPEQEGLETIQELRRDFPDSKIIAISGGAREGTLDFLPIAEKLGAQHVLHKPFAPKKLLEMIKEVLQ